MDQYDMTEDFGDDAAPESEQHADAGEPAGGPAPAAEPPAEEIETRPGGQDEEEMKEDGFQAEAVERIPSDLLEAAAGEAGAQTHDAEGDGSEPEGEDAAASPEVDPLARDIEAILFISPEPVSLDVLAEVTGVAGDELALAVESVRDRFSDPGGGIIFVELAGGYTFRTNDQSLPSIERFCQRPADYSLSAAAMETLAIVAYLQPITRPEIARIRGIGADTVVASLLEKGLLEESGRSRDSGAVKYRTTSAFEKLFGLAGLEELPSVEGFEATPQDVEELRQKLHLAADKRQ